MRDPIPQGGYQNLANAYANYQNLRQNHQNALERGTAGVMDSVERFFNYNEYNKQKALQDEQIAQQRAAFEAQMQANNYKQALAQKDLDSYETRLQAQLAANQAQAEHAKATTALLTQQAQDWRNIRNLRANPTKQPTPPTPPRNIPSTPIKRNTGGIPINTAQQSISGQTTQGAPLHNTDKLQAAIYNPVLNQLLKQAKGNSQG